MGYSQWMYPGFSLYRDRPETFRLSKPGSLKDIDVAVDLLVEAIDQQHRVLIVADFDADGRDELVLVHAPNMYVFSFDSAMQPTLRYHRGALGGDDAGIRSVALVVDDFDSDGQGELLIMDSHGYMYIITKQSSNNFTDFGSSAYNFVTRFSLPEPHAGFMRSGFMGDLDQDGKTDIYYNVNKL